MPQVLAVFPIQRPQYARLTEQIDDLARRAVDLDVGEDRIVLVIHVEVVARLHLEEPLDLARACIERENRVRVQQRTVAAAFVQLRVGRSTRGRPVHQVQIRIVAAGHPEGRLATLLVRHPAPGRVVLGRVSRPGNRLPAPELISRVRVVGAQETAPGRARAA